MPRTNKKACRGSGRPSGAVAGERYTDSSSAARCQQFARAESWTRCLTVQELGLLMLMIRLQPSNGAAFPLKHSAAAEALGLSRNAVWRASTNLREMGVVELAVQGDARRANWYRVPNPLPPAPRPEGGAA